jgi:AAA family ATP:ADP antiporter
MIEKTKISGLKTLIQEKDKKILIYLSFVVLFYGFTINYIDLLYKDLMKSMVKSSISFSANLGLITIFISLISICFCLYAANVIKCLGWLTAALISPFALVSLTIAFFVLFFINDKLIIDLTLPIIIVGSAYTGMNKALKDSFYEPTKEMVYIPMSKKDKQEGKAFISLIVNKVSKSISSGYQQTLIFIFGQFANASLSIFAFLLIAFGGWIYCIRRISSLGGALDNTEECYKGADEEESIKQS